MTRFNQALNALRAALVVASVSLMTLGPVGLQQASAAPSIHSATPATHLVKAANERWE